MRQGHLHDDLIRVGVFIVWCCIACAVDAASQNHAQENDSCGEDEELTAADYAVFVELRRHHVEAVETGGYLLRSFMNEPRAIAIQQRPEDRRQCNDPQEVRKLLEERREILSSGKPTDTEQEEAGCRSGTAHKLLLKFCE